MKFDDKSLNRVGKQIHQQLTKVAEHNREVYQSLGRESVTAWRAALGAVVAAAPLMGSLISAAAGAATLLAGALYSTVQSAYGAAPLLMAIGVAAGTAFLGLKSFFAALKSGDLSELTPSARAAAEAVQGLAGAWRKVRDEVQERMFKGLSDDIAKLGSTFLPVLQKGLGKMADSLNFLAQEMLNYLNSSAGLKTISKFLDNMADIFKRLSKAVVPFLDGFLRLMNALSPAGKRLADRIAEVATNFQEWTKGEGFAKRMDDMMKKAEKTAGKVIDVVVNLGKALHNIFNAANPATNTFLNMLVDLTERFLTWTSSVEGQSSIATWASQSVEVMRQFGKTAEAVFKVVAELADPRVITSFLKTVEGAFNLLGQLPLDKMVDAFVKVAEALQPVSSLFLAIVIGGAAFNIMVGSVIGQLGGFVGVLSKIIKFKIITSILKNMGGGAGKAGTAAAGAAKKTGLLSRAWGGLVKIFGKIKALFSKVIGVFTKTGKTTGTVASKAGKLSGAFKPVMSILGRFAKFAGPVGLAVWIATIIGKSKDLQKKLGNVWDALKEVGSALKGAFEEIGAALKPLAPVADVAGKAFSLIFDALDGLMGLAIGVFLDTITYAFKSLASVITGAGKIIAGLINVLIGLVTLDFGKMWDGLKQIASGIGPLLKGLFGLFISFFAPAKFLKLGATALKGLGGGIKGALPGILSTVGSFLLRMLKGFVALPGKLLSLGGRAISWLGRAVKTNAPKVLSAAGNIVKGVITWIGKLPGRLLTLGTQAVTRLAGAVRTGIGKLRTIATNIFTAVQTQIAKLPGKLLTLGTQAVTKLSTAVRTGVSKLREIATSIKDAVVNVLTGLPGKMLDVGKNIVSSLVSGLLGKLGALKDAASKIADTIKGFLPGSPVKEGPLTAWNRGGGATGGGRNVIDAITGGLDSDPIRRAMAGVADAVSGGFSPNMNVGPMAAGPGRMRGAGPGGRDLNITIVNPYPERASDSLSRTARNLAYLGLA